MASQITTSLRHFTDGAAMSSKRIHILGTGNIGKLFAKALAIKLQPPPITLLLHRASLLNAWEEAGKTIEIITEGQSNREGTFEVEAIHNSSGQRQDSIIENLIVATKTIHTAVALSAIKHRLNSTSTILFAQNGMGTVDEVEEKVFPKSTTPPRYLSCVVSHGLYTQGPFSSVHAGQGTIAIGDVYGTGDTQSYLEQQALQAPLLSAREVSPNDLKVLQLEKLVMNAMINPLTVIFNRRNGELFSSPPILRLMNLLLSEVSQVICALPEIQVNPTLQDRFSTASLHAIVLHVADITAKNTSSMLQDVRAKKATEIDYINGYIVQNGLELSIDCDNNAILIELVREGQVITESQIAQHFPDVDSIHGYPPHE